MRIISLTQGKHTIIDDEDFENVSKYKWCFLKNKNGNGYAVRSAYINGKNILIYLHRFIMNPPINMVIDHKDGNPLNCRKENMRICTPQQNSFNMKGYSKKTRYKGISIVPRKYKGLRITKGQNPYQARIVFNKKCIALGTFKTETEAARAYNNAAIKYFGEHAHLNEI